MVPLGNHMDDKRLEQLAATSEAIDLLRNGYPLDQECLDRLEAADVDHEEIEKEFSYADDTPGG